MLQNWGRRGPNNQQALNLGILYKDTVGKKHWVLKFDDEKALEQIDAVFVTLEPNGQSHKNPIVLLQRLLVLELQDPALLADRILI